MKSEREWWPFLGRSSAEACSALCARVCCVSVCLQWGGSKSASRCARMWDSQRRRACITVWGACEGDYRFFPYLWPSPLSRMPVCLRSSGRGRHKGGKEGEKKKAIGRFRGERCSGPVSFYGPLKKKRERMNILPALIDFSFASPALLQAPFLYSLK